MYDIQWRINSRIVISVLTPLQYSEYCQIITRLLQQNDDTIILQQRNIDWKTKVFCLSIKYGRDMREELYYSEGKMMFRNVTVMYLKKTNDSVVFCCSP